MKRIISNHIVGGLNEAIEIAAVDAPGPGGANHKYDIIGEAGAIAGERVPFGVNLRFQNGPIQTPADRNGITNEAIIAVAIDRMRGFQYARNEDSSFNFSIPGKYACVENAEALKHLESALEWLQKRTKDRLARGVEGTHTK
jgi:hypothetical protein